MHQPRVLDTHTQRTHLVGRHLVRVRDNGLQVPQDLALGQDRPILGVEDIKPVCKYNKGELEGYDVA